MFKLLIFPDPLDSKCEIVHDAGFTASGVPDTHFTGRLGQSFSIPDDVPNGFGCLLKISKAGFVSLDQKGKLWVKRDSEISYPWEKDQTAAFDSDDFRLHLTPITPPIVIPPSGNTPGCVAHVMINPKELFFTRINRKEGDPAQDWQSVLKLSGIPTGNVPGQKPNYDNGWFGITQQMRGNPSDPTPAGRLFLPTGIPDDLGYYAAPVSPLRDSAMGGVEWEFRPLGGPPYLPGSC